MKDRVIFNTKGKLDMRALTVFGLNAKPNTTNPIGYFGTGLKYAVATLMRSGHDITIWVGHQKWTIEVAESTFRGQEFKSLFLVRHRKMLPPKKIPLPFTTELGKNWLPWMAFRELEANTRDEGGMTWMHNLPSIVQGINGHTQIEVAGKPIVDAWLDRSIIFLVRSINIYVDDIPDELEIWEGPATGVYYKGIRVFNFPPGTTSKYTYNILRGITLTEDRTATEFDILWRLAHAISKHTNEGTIESIITATDNHFESQINFEYPTPSRTFITTTSKAAAAGKVNSTAMAAIRSYVTPVTPPVIYEKGWEESLINAIKGGDFDMVTTIIDRHRNVVIDALEKGFATIKSEIELEALKTEAAEEIPY
jgi:hypothetical protein